MFSKIKTKTKFHLRSYDFSCIVNNCYSCQLGLCDSCTFSPQFQILKLWQQTFWLKKDISSVLWPHCWTLGCFTSLIHHSLYSEPHVCMEMMLKHLNFNWIDRGKEYWMQPRLPCSWLLQQSLYIHIWSLKNERKY